VDSQADLWTEFLKRYLKFEGFVESVLGKFHVQGEDGVGPNLDSDLRCWRENQCVAIGS
jgi:hypothetical protein